VGLDKENDQLRHEPQQTGAGNEYADTTKPAENDESADR
jgi:hypothetical protein